MKVMLSLDKKSTLPVFRITKNSNKSSGFFYEGGGRSKAVNQILHCVRFSPGVIALTGSTGSGRSLLIQRLTQSFNGKERDLCLLSEDSAVLATEEELYRALAEGFGLEQKSVEMLEDLVDRVQHFIRVGLRAQCSLLIAIDDVKQHSEEVLEILLQIIESNKGLSLLLSGENSLPEMLKTFQVQTSLIHQITLRPLLTEEALDFIRRYLKQQGVSDELIINQKKMNELMVRTGGNFSLLVREAQQLAMNFKNQNKYLRTGLPIMHFVALILVIIITTLAFFYYPNSTHHSPGNDLQEPVAEKIISSDRGLDTNLPPLSGISKSRSDIHPLSNELSSSDADKSSSSKEMENPTESISSYTLQEQELLNKPAANMTLQVSSLSSEKMVRAFIGQCMAVDAMQMLYYRRGGVDKPSYVVLFGDYSTKQEAMNAQKTLPDIFQKSSPWPRSFADVQRDLRQREIK